MQKKGINTKFSAVEDFQKQYEKALDQQSKAEVMIIDYNTMASKIITLLNASGQEFLKANARYQDIEQLAKEFGIEPSTDLKNKSQTISIAIKEIDKYMNQLKGSKVQI